MKKKTPPTNARKKNSQVKANRKLLSPKRYTLVRKFFGALISLPWWASILTVVGTLITAYQILLGTRPDIQADNVVSPMPSDLPFEVKNDSLFFDIADAQFYCIVENVSWKGPGTTGYRVIGRAEHLIDGSRTIRTGETTTFQCDVSKDFTAKLTNQPSGIINLPVELIKARVTVAYVTHVMGVPWRRTSTSQLFSWRAVSGGYQWLPGDTLDSLSN